VSAPDIERSQPAPSSCEVCGHVEACWSPSVLANRCRDHAPPAWCEKLPVFVAWAEDRASRQPESVLCEVCPSYLCGHPWQLEMAAKLTERPDSHTTFPFFEDARIEEPRSSESRIQGTGELDRWTDEPARCWFCGEAKGWLGSDPIAGWYCQRHKPLTLLERNEWLSAIAGAEAPKPLGRSKHEGSDRLLFPELAPRALNRKGRRGV